MKLGDPDYLEEEDEIQVGSEYKVKADLVIKSLGFDQKICQNYLMQKNLQFPNGEQSK